jgi:hypothetical protein
MSVTLVNFFNFNSKDTIMKSSILNTLIITAALAATSGFAQAAPSSQYHDAGYNTVSNTSRAAVKADYLNARKCSTSCTWLKPCQHAAKLLFLSKQPTSLVQGHRT